MEQENKEVEEKAEDKTNRNFLFVLLALVIIAGIVIFFAYFYDPGSNIPDYPSVNYDGFEFEYVDFLWHTQWQKDGQLYNVRLHFNPYEVENVTLAGELDETFESASEMYITFDPEEKELGHVALTAAELSFALNNVHSVAPIAACTKNKTLPCSERPIVTCDDTDKAVILLNVSDKTGIDMRGNCVVLNGRGMDMVRAAEKAIYKWYKIIT
ncbi:MAG: YpmS family protein [bacterium]|nr:YpmS family protein [bacterium]